MPDFSTLIVGNKHSDKIKQAIAFAFRVHHPKNDRCGLPYFMHVMFVAQRQLTAKRIIIGLLHDTIEHKVATADEISSKFGVDIMHSVMRLTNMRGSEGYDQYIEELIKSGDEDAMHVKLADIEHNTDIKRCDHKAALRFPMYERSYKKIIKALGISPHCCLNGNHIR